MRVLWIVNILLPEPRSFLTNESELKSSGGWLLGAAEALVNSRKVRLSVATVSPLVKKLTKVEKANILYYVIPYGNGNRKINHEYERYWRQIEKELQPDIVHIHGTEFSHGYSYMKACGVENVVISIQGLKSAYYHYYYYGITRKEIYQNITLRDFFRGSIMKDQRRFRFSSKYEVEMLKMTKHIIGRTSWDRSRTWAINPDAQYHFCNETLREEFYDGSIWDYDKCSKNTIFLSQAGYPIKGLHQVLKAMPLILRFYPNTVIRVAGVDITKVNCLKDFIHYTGYGRYIKNLIKRLHLVDKVIFIGNLNADEMKQEYLRCNVFISPSSIENSPNSLGEAQILGTPCVASYVGGVSDMMRGNEENIYRFEEVEMLAEKVCKIFSRKDSGGKSISEALVRHNRILNVNKLLDIYYAIVGS